MFTTPILLLIFNRPDTTAAVFEQIKKLQPAYLYVAADGPRSQKIEEVKECALARSIVLEGIDWPCEMKTLFREENAGCKKAVSEGITWFFKQEERGIILEDDCLPDQSFFYYCEQLLEKYKDDKNIFSIGGTNLGYTFTNDRSYGYTRFMNMWGWATWRRSALLIDYNMEKWKRMHFKKFFLITRILDMGSIDINWLNYWKEYFDLTSSGKIDTWDYQWIFAQLFYRKVSIFPAYNLIKNIGFTEKATHTVYPDSPVAALSLQSLLFPLQHPQNKKMDKAYEEDYIKKNWVGIHKDSVFKIVKNRLLYISVITRLNRYAKSIYKSKGM